MLRLHSSCVVPIRSGEAEANMSYVAGIVAHASTEPLHVYLVAWLDCMWNDQLTRVWIELSGEIELPFPSAQSARSDAIGRRGQQVSPGWHRQARRKRSSARRRICACRASGCSPAKADLLRLATHHSRPPSLDPLWEPTWVGICRPYLCHDCPPHSAVLSGGPCAPPALLSSPNGALGWPSVLGTFTGAHIL